MVMAPYWNSLCRGPWVTETISSNLTLYTASRTDVIRHKINYEKTVTGLRSSQPPGMEKAGRLTAATSYNVLLGTQDDDR